MTDVGHHRAAAPAVAIGVDIGGTHVRAARIGRGGLLGASVRRRTQAEDVAATVVALCRDLLDAAVVGIGLGVPGRLDAERATVISAGYVDLAMVRLPRAARRPR